MNMQFSERIKELRKSRECSQEKLAEAFGISIQAVSKWECAQSYPDIELLPDIADYFGVTIDYLLRGSTVEVGRQSEPADDRFPDDGVLRIVQYRGAKLIRKDIYKPQVKIPISFSYTQKLGNSEKLQVEIWGSAEIDGDVYGSITAGDSISCGAIEGNVAAGDSLNCGNIVGTVDAGDSVNCGNIEGSVTAGDGVNCGNIGGEVTAGDSVNCGNVGGGVNCEGDLTCGDIKGNVNSCEGDIHCRRINGSVSCEGNIIYEK